MVTEKVVHGAAYRIKAVTLGDHLAKTLRTTKTIASVQNCGLACTILNKHCPCCAFQSRCRGLAVTQDDLSLLTAMTGKERGKYGEKGISTITQLLRLPSSAAKARQPSCSSARTACKARSQARAVAIKTGASISLVPRARRRQRHPQCYRRRLPPKRAQQNFAFHRMAGV